MQMSPEAQELHFAAQREVLRRDPWRPVYHFCPPGYGVHDPAGLCWWQGRYHLFYLFSVPGLRWGRGHAVSEDLVHWKDLPMLPAEIHGGTGQVWVDGDRVLLGVAKGKPAVFEASDPLLQKWSPLPVTTGGDNFVWREQDFYYLTRPVGGKGTALALFRSKDMAQWESMGNFFEDASFTDPGIDCSCPNILPLGEGKRLVLFFSHQQGPKYYVGTADMMQGRFTIQEHGRMSYGPAMRGSLHAPSGFIAPDGRCIGIWNVFEGMTQEDFAGTKNGVMSLPRQLALNSESSGKGFDKRELHPIRIEPLEELKALRFNPVRIEGVTVPANGEKVLEGVQGRAMELEVEMDPMKSREVGLRVLRSPNGEEQTTISLSMHAWAWPWKGNKRELMIDVSQASLSPEVASRTPEIGPLYLAEGEPLRLRVFIDGSLIEVFANGRQCLTLRAYPTRGDSLGVSVFARGQEAKLVALTAHQMKSIWPEAKGQPGR